MSTLYLHIGTPKTGTTAMQDFFELNVDELRSYGISYPLMEQRTVGDNRNGHFLSTRDYDPELDKRNWGIVESELKKYDKVLLSDEAIYRTGGYIEDFWKMLKKRAARTGSTLKAILYVRRQDDFFWSYYIQSIRQRQRILRLRESVLQDWTYLPYWNYYQYVKLIESVIGKENMIVRVYEKQQWKSENGSVVDDILEVMGIGPEQYKNLKFPPRESNLGVGDLSVAAKRYFNQVFFEKKTTLKYRRFGQLQNSVDQILSEKGMIQKRTGMTSDLRKKILKKYKRSNEQLAQEYFGRKDLFFDKTIEKGDTEDVFSRAELECVYNLWVSEAENFPEYGFSSQQMRELCDEALKLYDRGENYRFSRVKHFIRYLKRVRRLKNEQNFRAGKLSRFWQCE